MIYFRVLLVLLLVSHGSFPAWSGGESQENDVEDSEDKSSRLRRQHRIEDMDDEKMKQFLKAGSLNNNNLRDILLLTQNQRVKDLSGNTQNSEVMPNSYREPLNQRTVTEEGQGQRMNTYQRMYNEQRFDTSMPAQYSFRLQEEADGESLTFPQMESHQSNVSCSFSGCCTIF